MFTVEKVCPQYGFAGEAPDHVDFIGEAGNLLDGFEVLRDHFFDINKAMIAHPDSPRCIVELAAASLVANKTLMFAVESKGTVHVNGQVPEMDYYRITENDL